MRQRIYFQGTIQSTIHKRSRLPATGPIISMLKDIDKKMNNLKKRLLDNEQHAQISANPLPYDDFKNSNEQLVFA